MNRYSVLENKIRREILLLKGRPCLWGKCRFCDYIEDNSIDEELCNSINARLLDKVTGEFGVLEIINSGNIFELPQATLFQIKRTIIEKEIHTLFFEAHWMYRNRLETMREFFGIECIVKTGLESFDRHFREKQLNKGFDFSDISELQKYFDSVCLLVGVEGQTREMIDLDIKKADRYFKHFTVNVFIENSTSIKPDFELREWFRNNYLFLNDMEKCDVLWANTDFGVGH
ncbi:MAG: hypothetical protein JXR86_07710 [Spirochaetales bacterium]|nr:hypothetical protein [Spirochaetales bacterium]